MIESNRIIHGDCLTVMKNTIPDNSIDMIFTSPPYAERRKNVYGGVNEDLYVEWFKPIALELKRVMKPTASFFLNIKPHTKKGERSLYVFDLILSLKRELGFKFIDEFSWTKNPFPGQLKGRFKNGFEPIYHFTKEVPEKITFNPLACGTPIKEESIKRAYRKQCGDPKNGSKMTGMNTTNIRHLTMSRPSNVINANNVSNQFTDKQWHSATFPEKLSDFFIKSFTNENDIVLDPFAGSGTVGLSARANNRNYILIDQDIHSIDLMNKRLKT